MARVTYEKKPSRLGDSEPAKKPGLRGSTKLIIALLVIGAILYVISA